MFIKSKKIINFFIFLQIFKAEKWFAMEERVISNAFSIFS